MAYVYRNPVYFKPGDGEKLYLNIWYEIPAAPSGVYPCVIWIHGSNATSYIGDGDLDTVQKPAAIGLPDSIVWPDDVVKIVVGRHGYEPTIKPTWVDDLYAFPYSSGVGWDNLWINGYRTLLKWQISEYTDCGYLSKLFRKTIKDIISDSSLYIDRSKVIVMAYSAGSAITWALLPSIRDLVSGAVCGGYPVHNSAGVNLFNLYPTQTQAVMKKWGERIAHLKLYAVVDSTDIWSLEKQETLISWANSGCTITEINTGQAGHTEQRLKTTLNDWYPGLAAHTVSTIPTDPHPYMTYNQYNIRAYHSLMGIGPQNNGRRLGLHGRTQYGRTLDSAVMEGWREW